MELEEYLADSSRYDAEKLKQLETLLINKGTLDLNTEQISWEDGDIQHVSTIIRAANTAMRPMGSHWWARDNAIAAARLLATARAESTKQEEYKQLGRSLLLSALDILSSRSQLERFQSVITSEDEQYPHKQSSWPQIFLEIDGNLSGGNAEGWNHKQDAWQMAAYYALEAIDHGDVTWDELAASHHEMLGLCVPFLAKTLFWDDENSGSWEELTAVRSSVIAWDIALLGKLKSVASTSQGSFLVKDYERYKRHLDVTYSDQDLHSAVDALITSGAQKLAELMPYESPSYPNDDPRYREVDIALVYLLQLNIPELVTEILGLDAAWALGAERQLLEQIHRLEDGRTGGFRRYLDDSYQGTNFFHNVTAMKLDALYARNDIDSSQDDGIFHWVQRRKIVPAGPEAAWTHPVWQLSSWAGERFMKTDDQRYADYQRQYFEQGLRLITGSGLLTIEKMPGSISKLIDVPSWRIPEAYITESLGQNHEIILPSPDTPLNWAVAEAIYAIAMIRSNNA